MELSELTPVYHNGYSVYEVNGRLFISGAADITVVNAETVAVHKATTISARDVTTININSDCTMQVNGTYNLKANVINIEAESGLFLTSKSDLVTYSARTTNIRSIERLSLDGLIIDLNNNTSVLPPNMVQQNTQQQIPVDTDYAIYSPNCHCR